MHGTAFFSSLLVPPPTSQGYYFNLGHRAVVRSAGSWNGGLQRLRCHYIGFDLARRIGQTRDSFRDQEAHGRNDRLHQRFSRWQA